MVAQRTHINGQSHKVDTKKGSHKLFTGKCTKGDTSYTKNTDNTSDTKMYAKVALGSLDW